MILGTPFIFQHSILSGLNPTRVIIGSAKPLPIEGSNVTEITSEAIEIVKNNLEKLREELRDYARPLCHEDEDIPLSPFHAINHSIPLIDLDKVYLWHPSHCPEALRLLWAAKGTAYLKNEQWMIMNTTNTVPMLFLPKPGKDGAPIKMRTTIDLRERNANTRKMALPVPEINGILQHAAVCCWWSLIDMLKAFKQVHIILEHVAHSTVMTPDGNIISNVMQIGDCNASAMWQALMNHIFSPYIGKFMNVYLDDIVVYSDSLEEHIGHVKLIIDILHHEQLYLSEGKLYFLVPELTILGHVIDREKIRMDPDKVDALVKWKIPTNCELFCGFLGVAGFLADDINWIQVPMGVLHELTSDSVPFRWTYTHQHAFEDVKHLATICCNHHQKPLSYDPEAPPVNVVTDGCGTGIAGIVSQGHYWKTANVAVFYSAKLNSARSVPPFLQGKKRLLYARDRPAQLVHHLRPCHTQEPEI